MARRVSISTPVESACSERMYPGAHNRSGPREQGFGRQPLRGGLGQAKIYDPRQRLPVHFAYQNIGWFQIAMDDGFLVGMLDLRP